MKDMKLKITTVIIVMVFLVGGGLTAQEKYADFKALLREMIEISYTFIDEMDTAQTSTEVASAIENFGLAMEELEPRMDAMDEKYPNISDTEFPQELAPVMEEYGEMAVALEGAMMKMFEYMEDPEVQAAMEKME